MPVSKDSLLRSCLRGPACCLFDDIYANQKTLGEIFSMLDEHYNIFRPMKTAQLLVMNQRYAEQALDFFEFMVRLKTCFSLIVN